MKRRFLEVLLAAIMIGNSSVAALGAEAEVNSSAQEQIKDVEYKQQDDLEDADVPGDIDADTEMTEEPEQAPEDDFETELPYSYVSPGVPESLIDSFTGEEAEFLDDTLPTNYGDLQQLPPLRSCGTYDGMDWAFAVNAIAEINLAKKGYVDPATVDFSEFYLAYSTINKQALGEVNNDTLMFHESFSYWNICRGLPRFLYEMSGSLLSQWISIVSEEDAPYSKIEGTDPPFATVPTNQARLINWFKVTAPTVEQIKNYIYEYGAVGVHVGATFSDPTVNSETNIPQYSLTNSDNYNFFALVGWIGDYFILRNCKNRNSQTDYYSENGYCIVQYNQTLFGYTIYVFDFETPDIYDHNYQYDGGIWYEEISAQSVANIFTAEGDEILKAVKIYGKGSYDIDVYILNENYGTDPTNGNNVFSTSCSFGELGYHTIGIEPDDELESDIVLHQGDKFSVVLSQSADGKYFAENSVSIGLVIIDGWTFNLDTTLNSGQSFIKADTAWADNYPPENAPANTQVISNWAIKAFTKESDKVSVDPESIKILNLPDNNLELEAGQEEEIQAQITPFHYLSSSEVIWESAGPDIATVIGTGENVKIKGIKAGNTTVTATTAVGNKSVTINVTVTSPPLTGLSIYLKPKGGYSVTDFYVGEEYEFYVVPTPSTASIDDIAWTSSSESVMTIDSDGKAEAHAEGTTIIKASAGGIEATKTCVVSSDELRYACAYPLNGGGVHIYWSAASGHRYQIICNNNVLNTVRADGETGYYYDGTVYCPNPTEKSITYKIKCTEDQKEKTVVAYIPTAGNLIELRYNGLPEGSENPYNPPWLAAGKSHTLNPPILPEGFTFVKWVYSDSGEEAKTISSANRSVTIVMEEDPSFKYTVNFDATGGTAASDSMQVVIDKPYGQLPTATRLGYEFEGWYSLESGGEKITENTVVKEDGPRTLYAHWIREKYQIKFDPNGGKGTMAPLEAEREKSVTLTANSFTREDYKFAKWNTKADGSGDSYTDKQAVTDIVPEGTKEITLYAQWESTVCMVNFDAQGGTASFSEKKVKKSAAIGDLPTATRKGYKFLGWFTAAEGGTEVTKTTNAGDKDTFTVYAQWKGEPYIIYYTGNGGRGSMAPTNTECGKKIKLSANQFVQDGYRFAGWNTKEDGTGDSYKPEEEVIDLVTIKNGTILLYAQWRDVNDLIITFDAKGGKVTVNEKYVRTGKTYGVLPQATMAGYRFAGWSLDAEGSIIAEDTVVTKKADHTLYARWIEDETIQIFAGDLDVTEGEVSVKVGDAKGVTLKAKITPETSGQNVYWRSADTSKATVKENGLVVGISTGYVFVTATSKADPSKSARVRVHITDADPEKVDVSGNDVIRMGDEERYLATVTPKNAPQSVIWSILSAITGNGETAAYPQEYAELEPGTGSSVILSARKAGKVTLAATSTADSEIIGQMEITILPESAEGIRVSLKSGYSDEIYIGEKTCLKAVITPSSAVQGVRWESNNEKIAVVDSDGFVTGLSPGTAYIYAISKDNDAVRGSYRIKVEETLQEIAYLTVDGNVVTQTPTSVENGKGLTFIAYDASGKELDVTWIIENEDRTGNVTYATISGRGYFKATMADSFKDPALVRVTARVITGTDEMGALVKIIPVSSPIKQIPANKVYFDKKAATIYANGNTDNYINLGKLVHVIGKNKAEPSDPSLVWTSSNKNVAIVDYCGVVTALSTGGKAKAVTTITATTADGSKKKAKFKIVVENKPVELKLVSSKDSSEVYASSSGSADYKYKKLSLALGKSCGLKAVITPTVTDNKVIYKSLNTKVAYVSDDGKITGRGIGSATILARTSDGNLIASLKVTVISSAKSVKLDQKTIKLGVGNKYRLQPEVKPLDGSQKCTFTSEDTHIAVVDPTTGLVTALYEGTTNIVATSYDGSKKAKCRVVVGNAVKSIKIEGSSDCVAENKTIKLTPVFNGGDPEREPINKDVIWSIAEGVGTGQASIDSKTGTLKGISCGTVKVKCTCALDESVYGISDYIMVYVPVKKATINKKAIKLYPDDMYQLKVTLVPDTKDVGKSATLKKGVTYSLKNKADAAYVSVDASTGLITAKNKTKKPVVVIATYTPYGSKARTLQCKVTVK